MSILKISLNSFRNHDFIELDFSRGLTVIWGDNGSGKTSLLEAVHTLSLGKSFRTHSQKSLIKKGKKSFIIKGNFFSFGSKDIVSAQHDKSGNGRIRLNGKQIQSRKELIGRNNVVVLSPEEQSITKGPPKERRRFFDRLISTVSYDYLNTLQNYNRALKQRNAALLKLKENPTHYQETEIWDKQLVELGTKLWSLRIENINKYSQWLSRLVSEYSERIEIKVLYDKKRKTHQEYYNNLVKHKNKDKVFCTTGYGPHRDDIDIVFENKNLRNFGSQGEHKLSLIFLKLGEMCYVKEKTGAFPILLLDDLFAKLDLKRSKELVFLLNNLETDSGEPVQIIVTTTDMLNIEKSGMFSEQKEIKTHRFIRR